MKTKLIQALREAAKLLRTGFDYDWIHIDRCNCGVLASAILGRTIRFDEPHVGCWSDVPLEIRRCSVTGIPMPEVLSAMLGVGLKATDFEELEFCKNQHVLKRLKTPRRYKCPRFVASYMEAWADMLEEESQPVIPTTTQDQISAIEARDVLMETVKQLEPA